MAEMSPTLVCSNCLFALSNLLVMLLSITDDVNNQTITTEILQTLYVHQISQNEAILTTLDGFGITTTLEGTYTCLATNNLTDAVLTITVDVLGIQMHHPAAV